MLRCRRTEGWASDDAYPLQYSGSGPDLRFYRGAEDNRACFYHLVTSGRGAKLAPNDLSHEEARKALDTILRRTEDFHRRGLQKEVLTVDNHADGVYLYLKLLEKNPLRASEVYQHLKWNGGGLNSSGIGIADIDFQGNVHPDQFWMHYTFGNIRQRKFSEIWMDTRDPLLHGLRNRPIYIKGRCSFCKHFWLCGGSLRVRADLVTGDPWAPDPACYLTDEEIGLKKDLLEERGQR